MNQGRQLCKKGVRGTQKRSHLKGGRGLLLRKKVSHYYREKKKGGGKGLEEGKICCFRCIRMEDALASAKRSKDGCRRKDVHFWGARIDKEPKGKNWADQKKK